MERCCLSFLVALSAMQLAGQQGAPVACATSKSAGTSCAEEDNVNIPLFGGAKSFVVEATHPTYAVGADNCAADFTNCPAASDPSYPFTAGAFTLYDDGETVVQAVREATWWRQAGMAVSVDNGPATQQIHYLRLYRKIQGANEWPQFLVMYQDGNMRLIPQPPAGADRVCFGASVLIGPAVPAKRPLAEIASIRYVTATRTLQINYAAGGSAAIAIQEVSRQVSRVGVTVNYPVSDAAFATFRSMYVAAGNSDTDAVRWTGSDTAAHDDAIMTFGGGPATEWLFYRRARSRHNTSAPDIRIRVSAASPLVYAGGVVNAASFQGGPVAPGEAVSIFGCGLGPGAGMAAAPVNGMLGTSLAGTRVLFDDVPAALWYASNGQVNALAPQASGAKPTAALEVEYAGQRSETVSLATADAAPGVFTLDASGRGQGAILNQDGAVNSPANPAPQGSIVMIFATGGGQPGLPVRVEIGGVAAQVTYAGAAPGFDGLTQVNAQIPEATPPGSAGLSLTIGTRSSQPGVTLSVR